MPPVLPVSYCNSVILIFVNFIVARVSYCHCSSGVWEWWQVRAGNQLVLMKSQIAQYECKPLPQHFHTVPRYSRRPSVTCATAPWSCRLFISCAATPSTNTASKATLRVRLSAQLVLQRTAKSWTCCVPRTRNATCMITSTDR